MALDSLLCYKMSCRNQTLLLRNNQRNFTCNYLLVTRVDYKTTHIVAVSKGKRSEESNENMRQLKSDGLRSLDNYLGSLTKDKKTDNEGIPDSRMKTFVGSRRKRNENPPNESIVSPTNDESSDLYIVSILASIDIAVFLFEVASPIKNSDYNLFSLPLLYGAKVNDLILVGEWWRLVTPMFLGPVFAIIGAWLIYQMQNKDMIPKDVSEKMFRKATIATALSFGLVNFGLIDSWSYLGAALTGITYGFLTCPVLQLDDPLSKATREEGIAVVRQYANPCKSLGVFVLFVLVFSSMLYMIDAPLETPQLEDLVEIIE